MKKLIFIILAAAAALTLFPQDSGFLQADGVFPVNNRTYVPNMIKLFDAAQKTIHVLMLEGNYFPDRPEGINMQLYNAMFDAAKRGVKVTVILDQSDFNMNQSKKNLDMGEFFRENGVDVFYDDPSTTTHSKTLIVDSLYTVVGSTNWSYYALEKNNESSVIIKSKPVAEAYENYFEEVKKSSSEKMSVL